MTGVSYDTLQNRQQSLIRKMLEGSVFIAPITADPITSITDTDKLLKALPAGYDDVGWLSDAGANFERKVDAPEIKSWGSVEPTRTDIISDVTTLKLECQETKKATIGLGTGADMSGITADVTTGEVDIPKPARPGIQYHRALAVGVDLTDNGELYVARFLPRCRVTNYDNTDFQASGDKPLTFGVTLTAYIDSSLGYSERWLFGGAGWFAIKTAMGF
ncbi:MAG: hypothetical protein JWO67_7191 [Streptosporangiaceae bacterium]|nr:hypothetical protein [Streptosporangiaceae bacterium]